MEEDDKKKDKNKEQIRCIQIEGKNYYDEEAK